MPAEIPVFAVVGHPNQGKSSVVSTLVQDDHIAVSPVSGTTRQANGYRLVLGEQTLYELIDTPGFQRARQIVGWCAERSASPADRPDWLARFVEEHAGDPRYAEDCAVLGPILDGAGIVYVVDSGRPFSPAFEAELTLLSWTAQPRLALLNPLGPEDHRERWQRALNQYFSLTRRFDPLSAPFAQHLALLRAMAEVHPPWQDGLKRGAEALARQREERHDQAAERLVHYLQAVLRLSLQIPVAGPRERLREQGLARYNGELERREQALRRDLAELYGHHDLDWHSEWQSLGGGDLTDAHEWRAWGLSRARLASLSTAAGALSGLAVDVATGGGSLLLGALGGGVLGGLAGGFAGRDAVTFQWVSRVPGFERWQLGPVTSLDFALGLTGRALRAWYQLRQRNHARRDALDLAPADLSHWLDGLARQQQVQLVYWIRKLLKRPLNESEQNQLKTLILALGEQMDSPES